MGLHSFPITGARTKAYVLGHRVVFNELGTHVA
jgi:hypothetical protein